MRFHKDMLHLYAITEERGNRKRPLIEMVKEAIEGGVTILQLREKGLSTSGLTEKAKKVKAVCQRYNVPLIINDDVTAAIDSGADGVHVGADDMNVSEIRRMAGDDFIIGATAKTIKWINV